MSFKKIVVAGGGVLGSQIAYQAAYAGFEVVMWLRSEGSAQRAQAKLDALREKYTEVITLMATPEGKTFANWARAIATSDNFNKKKCLAKSEKAYKNIRMETDLAAAVKGADLLIEATVEDLKQKAEFYKVLAPVLPAKTVVVTNSSTLLPSKLAKFTGRPEKFLALHFANSIWKNNTAEVMMHAGTGEKYFDEVMEFATEMGMVALPVRKEKSGYLLNSMLVPLLFSGLDLYVNGVSDPESIDKAWTLGTGAPKGPFRILDTVGLVTAYNIVKMYLKIPSFMAPYNFKGMARVLQEYIDAGKTGEAAGEGFYKY